MFPQSVGRSEAPHRATFGQADAANPLSCSPSTRSVRSRPPPGRGFAWVAALALTATLCIPLAAGAQTGEPPYSIEVSPTQITYADLTGAGAQVTLTPKNASFIASECAVIGTSCTENDYPGEFTNGGDPSSKFLGRITLIGAPAGLSIAGATLGQRAPGAHGVHATEYHRQLTLRLRYSGPPLTTDSPLGIRVGEDVINFVSANGLLIAPFTPTATSRSLSTAVTIRGDAAGAPLVFTGAPVSLDEDGVAGTYHVQLRKDPGAGNTVTVTPSSSDTDAATVPGTALTFTGGPAGSWQYPQSVQVTPQADDDGRDESVFISHAIGGLPGTTDGGLVTVTVADSAAPGVNISRTALIVRTLLGGSYDVSLASQPSGDVTINARILDTRFAVKRNVASDVFSLTFTPANWNLTQRVQLDSGQDGTTAIVHTASSVDPDYHRIHVPDVDFTAYSGTTAPGVVVAPKSVAVQPGRTTTYSVHLATEPVQNVTITGTIGDTGHIQRDGSTAATFTLTFTPSNAELAQTVTLVHGGTDGATTITHRATSTDNVYNGIAVPTVTATAAPAGDPPYSLVISPVQIDTSGGAVTLTPRNASFIGSQIPNLGNGNARFIHGNLFQNNGLPSALFRSRIKLSGAPPGLTIASLSLNPRRRGEHGVAANQFHRGAQITFAYSGPPLIASTQVGITVDKSLLSFVRGEDGLLSRGSILPPTARSLSATMTLNGNASAAPLVFGGAPVALTEGGTGSTYTVRLRSDPGTGRTVTVTPSSGATDVATVPATGLVFTGGATGTWETPQSVRVTPVDDDDARDDTAYISHAITGWPGRTQGGDVSATVADADSAGIRLSTESVTVYEGETARYQYSLDSEPSDAVTISGAIFDTRYAYETDSQGPTFAVTFTTDRWNEPQFVDLSHAASLNGTTTISHRVSSGDPDYDNFRLADVTVTTAPQPAEPRAVLSVSSAEVAEGDSLVVTVDLVGGSPPGSGKSFPLVFTNGSAETADYTAVAGVTVAAGQRKGTASVAIADDNLYEGEEGFTVKLGTLPSNIRAALPQEATSHDIVIGSSDRPEIGISGGGAVTEGNPAVFTLEASNPAEAAFSIDLTAAQQGAYADAGDLGTDSVELTAGATTATFEIATSVLANDDPDGAVTAALQTADDYTIKSGEALASVPVRDTHATTVTLSADDSAIAETSGSTTVTVTLGRGLVAGESLSLPLAVAGTAELGVDYVLEAPATLPAGVTWAALDTSPTLTFTGPDTGAGATSATLILSARGDDQDEGDSETVDIDLPSLGANSGSGLSGGAEGSGSADVAINDDDDAPQVRITGPAGALTEGDTATFTIGVTGVAQADLAIDLTVSWDSVGDIVASSDLGTESLPLASGETSLTWEVDTIADSADEASGTLTVALNAGSGYTVVQSAGSASVAVADDDATGVTLASPAGAIDETGGSKTLTVSIDRGLVAGESLALPLRIGGAATFGTDYTLTAPNSAPAGVTYANLAAANPRTHRPTITFTGPTTGQSATSATLTLTASGDTLDEGAGETVSVGLPSLDDSSGQGLDAGASGSGSVDFTITDDDSPPVLSLATTSGATLVEGAEASFTISANNPSGEELAIALDVSQQGAVLGDGDARTRTVTLPSGDTELTWVLRTASDTTDEPGGSVTVALAAGDGYTISGGAQSRTFSVTDDDATRVTLDVPDGDIAENGGAKTLTLSLGRALVSGESLPAVLSFGGTATLGTDYTLSEPSALPSGVTYSGLDGATPTVLFTGAASSSASATLTLTATADSLNEGASESVTVRPAALGADSGTGLDGGAAATGEGSFAITDDDAEAEISIAAGSDVTEGGTAEFTLTATTASMSSLRVGLTVTAQGAVVAAGQTGGNKSVVIPAGATTATFEVPTQSDSADETGGSVTVTVNSGTGYSVSTSNGSDSVAVMDDDPTRVVLAATDATATEGDATATGRFTVTLGRSLATGESLAVPLFITGLQLSEFSLSLTPATGIGLSGPTLTFTGGSGAARIATVGFLALSDGNLITDAATITIPASSETGSPAMTATGLDGGAAGTGTARIVVTDAGAAPGVTVSPQTLTVDENGEATYTIVLDSDPGTDVTVNATSDDTKVTLMPASVSFTGGPSGNWSTPKTIRVEAGDDGNLNDETATISHTQTGYSGVGSVPGVAVTVTDAGRGYAVEPQRVVVTAGEMGTYKVRLLSRPAGAARFKVSSGTPAIATVPSIRQPITPQNWRKGRTITVNGVSAGTTTLTHVDDSSLDSNYASLAPADITVIVLPAAAPQISIAAGGARITEGSNASFTVSSTLAAQTGGLTVNLDSELEGDFLAAGATLPTSVTIDAGEMSASVSLATDADTTDEPNGSLTLTVAPGEGYGVGASASASAVLVDNVVTGVTLSGAGNIPETGGEGEISVSLGRSLEAGESLPVSLTLGGVAGRGTDYRLAAPAQVPAGVSYSNLVSGTPTITFTGGSTSSQTATLRVVAIPDTTEESAEGVTVALGTLNASSGTGLGGGASGSGSASFTIVDDDGSGPVISVSAGSAVNEGASASFTLTANPAPAGSLTVNLSVGQMGAVVDASNLGTSTATLSSGSASFTVATANDNGDEPDGSVTVTVQPGTGYAVSGSNASATATVRDNDATGVALSAPSGPLAEKGGTREITVKLDRALASGESLVVPLSFGGIATFGTDYTLSAPSPRPAGVGYANLTSSDPDASPPTATFTGGAGASATATLTLTATADSVADANETVSIATDTLTATGLNGGTNATGTVSFTIADEHDPMLPEVRVESLSGGGVNEGDRPLFHVRVSPSQSDPLPVSLTVTQKGDFLAAADVGTGKGVTIPAGQSGAFHRPITQIDSIDEPDGAVSVSIVAGAGYVVSATEGIATVDIEDDDATGVTLSAAADGGDIAESGGSEVITVTLDRPLVTGEVLPVKLTFSGVASFGEDYTLSTPAPAPAGVGYSNLGSSNLADNPPTITFTGGDGASRKATLTITAVHDIEDEGAGEKLTVGLGSSSGTNLSGGAESSGTASFVIADDDGTPVIRVTGGSGVTEGGTATFTLHASPAPQAALDVTVNVTQALGDFVASTGLGTQPATIAADAQSATYEIVTVNDTGTGGDEPSGSVKVAVVTGAGYAPSMTAPSASVAVTDNDPTSVTLSTPDTSATEKNANAKAQIRIALGRSLVAGEKLTVPLNFSGATLGTEFSLDGSTVSGVATDDDAATATFTGPTSATFATFDLIAEDDVDESDETVTVSLGTLVDSALDGGASGTRTGNGQIAITDAGPQPGVDVDMDTVALSEGGTVSYRVKLHTNPGGSATVTPVSGDKKLLTVPGPLNFNSSTWATWQTVTVESLRDNDLVQNTVTITHKVNGYGGVTAGPEVTASIVDGGYGVTVTPDVAQRRREGQRDLPGGAERRALHQRDHHAEQQSSGHRPGRRRGGVQAINLEHAADNPSQRHRRGQRPHHPLDHHQRPQLCGRNGARGICHGRPGSQGGDVGQLDHRDRTRGRRHLFAAPRHQSRQERHGDACPGSPQAAGAGRAGGAARHRAVRRAHLRSGRLEPAADGPRHREDRCRLQRTTRGHQARRHRIHRRVEGPRGLRAGRGRGHRRAGGAGRALPHRRRDGDLQSHPAEHAG